MKIYVSALLLTIGVVLHFGVSSSMPSSPPNQPTTSRRRPQPMFIHRHQDQPEFDDSGELVAIFYNQRRIDVKDMVFEEKDPNVIPDFSWLWRIGPPRLLTRFKEHKILDTYDHEGKRVSVEAKKNDLVMDPDGFTITGIFRDHGHYDEIVQRNI